jgi:glucose-1-phosphate adenylyltransferase
MKNLKDSVLAFVLAGGRGGRLDPLTLDRTKPSVPFGGKYRIIDFALSNLINSGIYSIYVLVQYKSQSLIEHIRTSWRRSGFLSKHFITVVPPQMSKEETMQWYRGTADSVYQNINLIYDFKPRFVAIFGGDHVYRMDIREMVDFHIKNKSQATISVIPAQAKNACEFGVVKVDSNLRVKKFTEKPVFFKDKTIFASMGNYIFDANFLTQILTQSAKREGGIDFGRDIIPQLVKGKKRVFAYDFSQNRIPSLKRYEAKYYWRDVGSLVSYWQANRDLLKDRSIFDLDNKYWPIYASKLDCPPAYTTNSKIENSLICEGTKVLGSSVKNSILGRSVLIEKGCSIEDSIIMDRTRIGKSCRIKNTIIDRFNFVRPGTSVGYDKKADSKKYHLDPSGIVVIKRGSRVI